MGSSREREARGLLKGGNSVALTGGLPGSGSGGVLVEGLGTTEFPPPTTRPAGGHFSVVGSTCGEVVIERLGGMGPVVMGDTLSPSVVTVDSETTMDVCLGRAKPWVRFASLSLIFVGERMSFLELVGVADRTGGDGLIEDTAGVLLNGELLKDLMSMRGLGKLRPEEFDMALPGLRG